MSVHRLCASLLLLSICAALQTVSAEELMPTRPQAVVEIQIQPHEEVRSILEKVVSAAKEAKCEALVRVGWSEGYFECTRVESPFVHHKAVIWLEWKLTEPGRTLRVLMAYAKVQNFAGSGWARVPTSPEDEVQNTQLLRGAILGLAGLL